MERRSVSALVAATLLAPTAFASDLTVLEAVFTSSISNLQYGRQVPQSSPARPIYFWTKLQGGKEAFKLLQSQGKLPIRHYWTSRSVFNPDIGKAIEPTQEADDRTLSAGLISDVGGMRSLVEQGQPFTWRTWTYKRAIWAGTWVVRVLYADGQPVMCGAKACAYTIELSD